MALACDLLVAIVIFVSAIYRGNLAIHTLHHRLILVIMLEQFDKLLAAHVIRKRPKDAYQNHQKVK